MPAWNDVFGNGMVLIHCDFNSPSCLILSLKVSSKSVYFHLTFTALSLFESRFSGNIQNVLLTVLEFEVSMIIFGSEVVMKC